MPQCDLIEYVEIVRYYYVYYYPYFLKHAWWRKEGLQHNGRKKELFSYYGINRNKKK
jgi:hypothetical protein